MELMQQWSEWQSRRQHSLTESVEEILECGEEAYYPALHVGSERYAVSFCVDYQARENIDVDDGAVPLYNREFTLGSTALGDSSNTESLQNFLIGSVLISIYSEPRVVMGANEVEDEDKPSGITIFGDGEAKGDHEEGELPEKGDPSPPRKKMTVEFPGINAPVPENGDPWLWGSTPPQSSSSGRHHHPSSDSRDRGLLVNPGAEHYSSSRYHPYDGGPATPGLVRSHSDRGRRGSSSGYYENPPPPPGEEGAWTPHSYSSRQHSSGSERHSRDRHYYSSRR